MMMIMLMMMQLTEQKSGHWKIYKKLQVKSVK